MVDDKTLLHSSGSRPLDTGEGGKVSKKLFFWSKKKGGGGSPLAPPLDLPLLQGEEIYCTVLKWAWFGQAIQKQNM